MNCTEKTGKEMGFPPFLDLIKVIHVHFNALENIRHINYLLNPFIAVGYLNSDLFLLCLHLNL
jgi:hypothetical protein